MGRANPQSKAVASAAAAGKAIVSANPATSDAAATTMPDMAEALARLADDAEADRFKVRLTSRRAPYTRGGVKFVSNRQPVLVGREDVTEAQLKALAADAAITIELVNTETGAATVMPSHLIGSSDPEDQRQLAELMVAVASGKAEAKGGDA